MMKKVTLYFIRHGETYLNKYKRMQGWADTPLTEEGVAAAAKLGEHLKDEAFDFVYSSDLGRTIETAQVILNMSSCNGDKKVIPKRELRESFFGSFEGEKQQASYQAFAKAAGVEPEELFRLMELPEFMALIKRADPFGEAESYEELWDRLDRGLEEMVNHPDNPEDARILVVTHGNTIRNIFTRYDAGVNPADEIKNASISTLVYAGGEYHVEGFNEMSKV